MGIILTEFEQYFNNNPLEDFSPHEYKKIISDLYRSSSVCSAAFNKAALITCTQRSQLYYISDSYRQLTGYSKEEVLSMGDQFIMNIMHPDDLEDLAILRESLFEEVLYQRCKKRFIHHTIHYNYRIQHKNGHWIVLDCHLYPICIINNRPHFFISYISPINEFNKLIFQIYFFRENKRYIYNNCRKKFVLEEKVQLRSIEISILEYIAKGNREHEIAKRMDVDVNLIKYYKKCIMSKLSVNSMPEAIYYALKQNYI